MIGDDWRRLTGAGGHPMLSYDMDSRGELGLYEHLYRCIRDDILSGTLDPNDRLPSKRRLAEHLGVSVITVEGAYRQLVAEGYAYSLPKRGFYVSELPRNARSAARVHAATTPADSAVVAAQRPIPPALRLLPPARPPRASPTSRARRCARAPRPRASGGRPSARRSHRRTRRRSSPRSRRRGRPASDASSPPICVRRAAWTLTPTASWWAPAPRFSTA